jgi:Cellulase (glycosyl hydrolase family 5)
VAHFPRRKFLKTIGGAAVASAFPELLLGAQSRKPSVAVFWEQGFPGIDDFKLIWNTIDGSLSDTTYKLLGEQELIDQLNNFPFDLLITPYGSAFPKRAWNEILKFLRRGGNWLNLGGVPLSRPVVRAGSGWRAEAHQTTYHKQLGITHSFPVKPSDILWYQQVYQPNNDFRLEEIYELYLRLSSSKNEPNEDGSDGPHEGVVRAIVLGVTRDRRHTAAPVIQIDRLLGEFAGGRWVFANFTGRLGYLAISVLVQAAARGASRFEVKSEFACYKPGEIPSLSVQLTRPKADLEKLTWKVCVIEVRNHNDHTVWRAIVPLDIKNTVATASVKLPNSINLAPGYYNVYAQTAFDLVEVKHTTGFWIYDEVLMTRGKPLTVDKHFFYRDARVFPVTGTTYMASDVHRRFLLDPNPHVWDNDFRAMKDAGVNMIRTGIWTGWRHYMSESGQMNEAMLRAFDAFLLTAHKYDIPVIFTFFAFLPHTWGGENAYLDPRSIKAQQQFISGFTERCRRVDDVIWDFINEPSFGSYKYIWSCRPNYDAHEKAAWQKWLRERYPAATDEEHAARLQEIWRTNSDDLLEVPKIQDFESVNLIDERRPLKTLDFRLFAQDMFIRWVRQMTMAIRSNGNSKQLITVGQDENGLGDSPNPQFFAREIDFTSLHNWWNNDDLVWDSVVAKPPSKMMLMEETGVMFYEKSDGGAPWRSEEEVSRLLERKMALSFAADGSGFIEWVWNTNPYMHSTNEVGIGFHRVDGTEKPELEPFRRIAKFMAQHGHRLKDRISEPVAMVIPHSQMFSPRSYAHEATRKCVRAMYYHCGVPMQAVSEYTLAEYAGQAKLIVVPSPRVLTDKCWDLLLAEIRRGATVAISGPIDTDDHWLPVKRSSLFGSLAQTVPIAESEAITIGARQYSVRYEGDKMQRIEKAVMKGSPSRTIVQPYGLGRVVWSPLPLELGDSFTAIAAFYRQALALARIAPIFKATPRTPEVLILPSVFRDVVLYTFISEASRDVGLTVTHLETRYSFNVLVPAGRTAMVFVDRR